MAFNCFRIFNDNFLDLDILANNFVSSEQTPFPVTNAYNAQRRSKVWRSEGYFNITSSNNVIIFTEGGGDITATIAVAEYTSISDLQGAIGTALSAAGVFTYSALQDNFRFKIDSSGSFSLTKTSASFTASSILGYDTTADTALASSHTADFVRIHEEEWIKWDFGISTNPAAFILIGKRNDSIQISPSATIKLQGNETDVWSSPSYEATLTYDDESMAVFSDEGLHTEPLRYWRLLIIDVTNPNGFVEVGAFMLGDYLFSESRGKAQFPLNSAYIDRTETFFSEGGQSFSDIRDQSQEYGIEFAALQKADIEEFRNFFVKFGTGIPFFVSMDTDAVFSTAANRRIVFVKFASEPDWSLDSPDNFSLSFDLREEL